MEWIIVIAFGICIALIAVLSAYIFYLNNLIDHRDKELITANNNTEFWIKRCEDLVEIHKGNLDQHDKRYDEICEKFDELYKDNTKKEEELEMLKAKLEAFVDNLDEPKVINLPFFGDGVEELDFPNSNNKED